MRHVFRFPPFTLCCFAWHCSGCTHACGTQCWLRPSSRLSSSCRAESKTRTVCIYTVLSIYMIFSTYSSPFSSWGFMWWGLSWQTGRIHVVGFVCVCIIHGKTAAVSQLKLVSIWRPLRDFPVLSFLRFFSVTVAAGKTYFRMPGLKRKPYIPL